MKKYELGNLCNIVIGRTPARKNEAYWGKGYPWVSISDLKDKNVCKTKEQITDSAVKESRCRLIPKGTLLFSFKLTIGKMAFANCDLYTNEAIAALLIKNPEELVAEYLFYALKVAKPLGSNQAVMGKTLNSKSLAAIKVPVPEDVNDQIRIATLLSRVEALIATRKNNLQQLDDFLKSTFLDMFGDPVRNEKGWDTDTLDELVAEDCPLTYGIVQPGDDYPDGIPIVRPVDLIDDYVTKSKLKTIDPIIDEKFKRTKLKGGEILMCVRGTTGVMSIASKELDGSNVTRGITPIWFDSTYDSLFAFHLLKSEPIQRKIQEKTYGVALKQINLKDLRKLILIKPPKEKQELFSRVAIKGMLVKGQYEKSLIELETLYAALSQKAFKGELDLSRVPLPKEATPKVIERTTRHI